MRRVALLALLVPLLAGCGWASLFFGGPTYVYSGGPAVRKLPRIVVTVPTGPMVPIPRWISVERLPRQAIPGARLFANAGCTACHRYAGSGTKNLGAPDLTSIGTRHLGISFEVKHLQCPSCVVPGSPMPRFASLGKKRLNELAIFLEASKGRR